jgi:hypothetical protein
MILTLNNYYIITLVWYIFLKQLKDNPLTKKLTNIRTEFGDLLNKDFSNSSRFSGTVNSFYGNLVNTNSLLKDYVDNIVEMIDDIVKQLEDHYKKPIREVVDIIKMRKVIKQYFIQNL